MTDLPGLLRIACAQGKMRLNVFHSAANGYQASLANSGDGWTCHSDGDALAAIEAVLHVRYGATLERQRAGDPRAAEAVHPAHRGSVQLDIEDAIARAGAVDVDGLIG